MSTDWFAVHKDGLAQQLERRGKEFAVLELIQNGWDEPGVTRVDVELVTVPDHRRLAVLSVVDDAPDGFSDLTDAWTLFAPSKKKTDYEKRGRFNVGEKLVLALCRDAEIISTRGGVRFDADGRHNLRQKRERGSVFSANIRFTQKDIADTAEAIHSLIPPTGIDTYFNGELLDHRSPIHAFEAQLGTEIADSEGYLRPTRRITTIRVYEPKPGETPSLYEMGIPIVETGDKWHVDIAQKVPLNTDRDNVRPAYLREVRTLVTNEMYKLLIAEDTTRTWTREALADERISDEAVVHLMDLAYGTKRVSYDPSDPEANKRAVSEGYAVVYGNSLSKPQWENVRRAEAVRPAGQVTPGHHIDVGPDGKPPIDHDKWTPAMQRLAEYTQALGVALLGYAPTVEYVSDITEHALAWFGGRRITYNKAKLSNAWIESPNQELVDALILHEFAHNRISDHLSYAFPDEIARLGAKLRNVKVWLSSHEITAADEEMLMDIGMKGI